jgi:poly-gamma-glutamate capsule biosynthesis protein CapA/YwtB (metallophosphatase superfamily)
MILLNRLVAVFFILVLCSSLINPMAVVAKSKSSISNSLKNDQSIRVTFAGDLMLDWSIKNTIKKKGINYPFEQVRKEVSKSDISIANLETAVTKRTKRFPKTYNFKANPSAIKGVTNAGFDLVSLANNHSMDYGQEGLIDTLNELKKRNLPYIGAGKNSAEAYRVKTFTVKGKKISFLAFSRVIPAQSWVAQSKRAGTANGYNLNTILKSIKKVSLHSDYVFVYMHWGIEKNKKPEKFQRQYAKKMIDAGADAVIGSHSHVLQGFEYYKGKPIAYSLGNFLFPDYVSGEKAQTGLLHLDIHSNKIKMTFSPYRIYKDHIRVQSLSQKRKVWKNLQARSFGIKVINGKIDRK